MSTSLKSFMDAMRMRRDSGRRKNRDIPGTTVPKDRTNESTKTNNDSVKNLAEKKSRQFAARDERCVQAVDKSKSIPVYWINLPRSKFRRHYFEYQLGTMGLVHKRIQASTKGDDVVSNSTIHVSPKINHTPFELSCVISHLIAIHTAIYDEDNKSNPYALITEDDINFEMDVDLLTLAEHAPKNFGVLQLMTSASSYVGSLWKKYKEDVIKLKFNDIDPSNNPTNSINNINNSTNLNKSNKSRNLKNIDEKNSKDNFPHHLIWKPRRYDDPLWSTQAYLINKKNVRKFIDKMIKYDNTTGRYKVDIFNPSEKDFPCPKKTNCYLPFRIVSDMYIFSGCNPAYTSKIPMFNGASVGANSTIHLRKNNDVAHAKSFIEIAGVLENVRNNEKLLPPYIRVKKNCVENSTKK